MINLKGTFNTHRSIFCFFSGDPSAKPLELSLVWFLFCARMFSSAILDLKLDPHTIMNHAGAQKIRFLIQEVAGWFLQNLGQTQRGG